jgi:hypothetical protein
MKSKFSEYLKPLVEEEETLDDQKNELCDFIQSLDKETFSQLMDVLSSVLMDPLEIGSEDDASEEIEGDDAIKAAIADASDSKDIAKALDESLEELESLTERGHVSPAERLKAAREKKRNPKFKRLNRIKNAWNRKCAKRKLSAGKTPSGKWGCSKVNPLLSLLSKKWQHNRQSPIKA